MELPLRAQIKTLLLNTFFVSLSIEKDFLCLGVRYFFCADSLLTLKKLNIQCKKYLTQTLSVRYTREVVRSA